MGAFSLIVVINLLNRLKMSSGGCCPADSLPKLAANYKEKGTVVDVPSSDLKLYVVGSGDKAIVHYYDIWGLKGGRTRLMCDQLSEQGYKVVIPDFYRGDEYGDHPLEPERVGALVKKFPPEMVLKDTEAVIELLKSQGVTKFGATGTCWGAWAIFMCCARGIPFSVGASYHPALGLDAQFGGSALDLAKKVKVPQLLMPASNDPADVKPNGEVIKAMEDNGVDIETKEYPDMMHGWVPRGDLNDPKVARDVEDATNRAIAFLAKYMK